MKLYLLNSKCVFWYDSDLKALKFHCTFPPYTVNWIIKMILTKMTLENISDVPQICSGTLRIAPRALNFQHFLGELAPPSVPSPWDAFSSGASRHILSLTKFLGTPPPPKSCIRPWQIYVYDCVIFWVVIRGFTYTNPIFHLPIRFFWVTIRFIMCKSDFSSADPIFLSTHQIYYVQVRFFICRSDFSEYPFVLSCATPIFHLPIRFFLVPIWFIMCKSDFSSAAPIFVHVFPIFFILIQ